MNISTITVAYHSEATLKKLLDSLAQQTDKEFKTFIINNSQDDADVISGLCAEYPFVSYFANPKNNGFAGGNNIGIQKALAGGADWVVLLNPDTEAGPELIKELREGLHDQEGLIGFPIQEPKQKVWGGKIQWLTSVLDQNTSHPDLDFYIHGGAMAIHKKVIEKIGYLDEEYFLYFEDAAYSVRAKEAGIKLTYLNKPTISHLVSASTKALGPAHVLRYHYRNALNFNFKHAPLIYKIWTIFWSLFVLIKQTIKLLDNNHPTESRAILAGIVDFYQEKMGFISNKTKVGIECEQIEGQIWGVGKIITQLLENISQRPELEKDFEFHLFFKSQIPKLPFLDAPIFRKEIIYQPQKHKSFVLYYYLILPIRLWFKRLDVMFFPNYMLPLIFFGNSLVMMTEDIYYEMRSSQQKPQHRLAYWVFATWATLQANKIMAISETSKKEIMRLFDVESERIAVNHLAIEHKESTGENTHGQYFLFVGQAFPRRRLMESLLAFEKIAPDYPNTKFIIVGPDKYNPPKIKQLQQKINLNLKEDRVIHYEHVHQEQLTQLYSSSLATVYISSREAFGLPPLEALAQGSIPVIADNELGHELFKDCAVFVSRPDSIEEISLALKEVLTNSTLRERIKEQAPEITNRYTWEAHTDRFIKTIKSMTQHD